MSNGFKQLLEFGPFRLDPQERLLLRQEQPVPLSPKAFDLLLALVQHSGQVMLKDDLMNLLWPDTFVEESNLGQHISQLRKALGERAQAPSFIITVPGRGYRFAHKVRIIPADGDDGIVLESHTRSRVVIEEESVRESVHAAAGRIHTARMVAWTAAAVVVLTIAGAFLWPPPSPPKVLRVRQITHSGLIEPYGRVLSDASRLYFTERLGGTSALAEAPLAGGESRLISTSVPSLMVYDIDPETSRLLVGTQGPGFNQPLWILPATGGSGQRVGGVLASEGVAWLPGRRQIIYARDAEIYTADESGSDPVKLLTTRGEIISLRIAPDGRLLRFTVRDSASGGYSLWESSMDGRNPHPLSFGWNAAALHWGEGECCGNWSPDGRYFVFRTEHDGVQTFWAIREKRSWLQMSAAPPVQLYASPDHIGEPRFSPDGKKIFFVDYQERRELVRYDAVHKLFVPYLGGIPARLVSFSPGGDWVAYRNETDGSLWRSRVDGTDALRLTFPPIAAYHSSWLPDGKRIVFEGRPAGEAAGLYSIPFDGGNPEPLTTAAVSDTGPSCSPDGRSVLFEHWTFDESGVRTSAVYILDLSTRETRMVPGSTNFDGAHWSPDGKYAAAADQVNHKLMLFDFARQRWSELSDGAPYGWGIRWSSDSHYVYYQHLEADEQTIFRVRVSDRKVEQITSAQQIVRADVLSYSMTGLTPDNSPLASFLHRNSDVYAMELELP
jgi:DNA-binding winged helix-turn-helix (wHTH) protein/Tol biopolymer transport system component